MLHLLDESLEAFLRAEVPLSTRQVDVSFEAPDSEWGARVSKPTVNLFLWDVRNNFDRRESGMEVVQDENGKRFRAPPKPRVDCRYLVTAWTSEVKDEHQLLGSLLTAFLTNHEVAPEYLQGAIEKVRPVPTIEVGMPDGADNSDFWTALGGHLKPGLDVIVTATVDLKAITEAGPPVERYELTIRDRDDEGASDSTVTIGGEAGEDAAGSTVRSPRDVATVDADGRFRIRADSGDELALEGEGEHKTKVPAAGSVRLNGRKKGKSS